MTKLTILGLAGSLRRRSFNYALLRAAQRHSPTEAEITIHHYADLPHYNDDLEADDIRSVVALKGAIRNADGVLIASPEYNYSIPGVLKNALDWASRPAFQSVFAHKPVATMGASGSTIGTARAQAHLRQVLAGMAAHWYVSPELLVASAATKFDDDLELTDSESQSRLREFLQGFVQFIRQQPLKPPQE